MCGRYVLVQRVEVLEKRFQVRLPEGVVHTPQVNIGIGARAPVITDRDPDQLQLFTFGLTPFWAKKPMYLFNARAEGDHNLEDDAGYRGSLGIISKPAFRKPIRGQRCLVPADAFIEGTTREKLARPFLVQPTDREPPFAFAGIWDAWADPRTGELLHGFALITTPANATLTLLPHHRCPVILDRGDERLWLDRELPLTDVLSLLRCPPAAHMNAWPIDPGIRHPGATDPELLRPIGPAVRAGQELAFGLDLVLQGMGGGRRRS